MVLDAGGGYGSPSTDVAHDWTEGTGVLPASGSIVIPNPSATGQTRKWLLVQNQSAGTISVIIQSTLANGVTASTVPLLLSSGGGTGTQGGMYENYHSRYAVSGTITVSGAAGSQVLVLEVLQ